MALEAHGCMSCDDGMRVVQRLPVLANVRRSVDVSGPLLLLDSNMAPLGADAPGTSLRLSLSPWILWRAGTPALDTLGTGEAFWVYILQLISL